MSKQYPGGFITKNFTAPTASAAPGVWTLDQAMYYIKQSLWPLPPQPDPYFPYVTALLHGNGNAAGTTLFNQDLSGNNLPLTINNDLSANTKTPFTPPAGTSTYGSGYFPGSNGYLYTPSNTAFGFGTGDFTLEAWVWLGAQVNTYPNWIQFGTANNNASLPLSAGWGDSGMGYVLMIKVGTDRTISGYNQSSFVGVWSHIAVVRSSGVVKTYINGTAVDTWANTADVGSTNFMRSGCGINEYGNFPWNGYISNLRVTNTAVYTTNFTPSTSPLTAVSGTKLLTMQTNFTGNNNLFYDSSSNNFPITRNGNTTQGTFTPYGSNWSNYFNGSSAYLSVANATALQLSGSQFTIEGWFYLTVGSTDNNELVCQSSGSADANVNYQIRVTSTNKLRFLVMSGASPTYIDSTTTITTNSWHHFACVCDGSGAGAFLRMWVDGVYQTASSSFNASGINTNTAATQIGAWTFSSQYLSGYISNFRILKGTALYTGTSNITVPTSPLTAITNTSLLTCQSNRFIDNSSNAFTVTTNGSPSVQRFSPFSPTTAYSTSVIGGSGYFDGSGDYLTASTTAGDFGSSAFTIEAWVYFNSASGTQVIGSTYQSASVGWSFGKSNSTGCFYVGLSGDGNDINGTTTVVAGTWYHVAISGTPGATGIKLFVNGVQEGSTYTGAVSLSATVPVYVGDLSALGYVVNGYISNFRLVKGTAVYTSNFTPPTAPLTAITNTSLLLSYTNAGILDNAMMLDWETIGDATVSPTTYKYGAGSMKFDGTADRLTAPSSPNMAFGTGDFTIEGWFYINSGSGTNNGALQISGTTGGLQANQTNNIALFSANSSGNKWGVYYANTFSYGSASTTQTWTYIALVRSSGSLKLYINGTVDATFGTKTDTTNYTGQNICVGGYYSTAYLWNGYIDDLRITKGVARYTANFTPPTSAFPDL